MSPSKRVPTISADAKLGLALFDRLFGAPSWAAWRAWLLAVLGLGPTMTKAEQAIYYQCTGRSKLPTQQAREAWTIAGRRSGKTRQAGFAAGPLLAAGRTYRLAPGERGRVPIISPSKAQGTIALEYADAMLHEFPALQQLVAKRTSDAITLSTRVSLEIQSASFRTPRGYTNVGAVCEEIAYWRDDSGANPDTEILRAIRPSLASVPGALLVAISSPYAARGELFRIYEKHFGRDDSDILVWQAPTTVMNPTIPQALIDREMEEDPASANAEWLGQFRSDLESLFSRQALDAVIARGRFELAPMPGTAYVAFIDPSGGSSDSMTLGVAHRDGAGRPILDLVREVRPPFSPEAVCEQFARELKRYGITRAVSDAYAGEWPREGFAKQGIRIELSPLTRSELYLELLAPINSGACELLDLPRLVNQLAALERRTGHSGRDSIDHPRGSHDDLANACAGACVMAVRSVGLRASYPAEFRECLNYEAFAARHCVLLARGANLPADPHCHRVCAGLKAVKSAYQAYQQSGGALPLMEFISERFEPNDLTSRFKLVRAVEALGL